MNDIIRSPNACSPQELRAFEQLVIAGRAVERAGLSRRLRSALQLLFLKTKDGVLAGIGALKRPGLEYRTKVFRAAEAELSPDFYTVELGWVVVDEPFRGQRLPSRIVRDLVGVAAKDESLFATTRADKLAMHYALGDNGFQREGVAFPSERDDYKLVLFIKRHPTSLRTHSSKRKSLGVSVV